MKPIEKEDKFVSLVLYTCNDAAVIGSFLVELSTFMRAHFTDCELLIMDDCSEDGTPDVIKEQARSLFSHVVVLRMAWRQGREVCFYAASNYAVGDYIFEFDHVKRDYDWDTPSLMASLAEKFDIVAAVPKVNPSWYQRLFFLIFNLVSVIKLDASHETLRIVSRRAVNAIMRSKEKYRYRKIQYRLTGFPIKIISYQPGFISKRRNFFESMGLALSIITGYSEASLQMTMGFCLMFFLLSLSGGVYALYSYFVRDEIARGWTTIMLLMSMGFSGLFFCLALAIKYLSNILAEVRPKPVYTITQAERLNEDPASRVWPEAA